MLLLYVSFFRFSATQFTDDLPFVDPASCGRDDYFDPSHLSCHPCPPPSVSSPSRLACVCPSGWRSAGGNTTCERCPEGTRPSSDSSSCLACPPAGCGCPRGSIRVERTMNGTALGTLSCMSCVAGTAPSADGTRCAVCDDVECRCRNNQCPSTTVTDSPALYTIPLEGGEEYRSLYLETHLNTSAQACAAGSPTSCQALANLCVLSNFNRDAPSACTHYEQMLGAGRTRGLQWKDGMPQLFYYNVDADSELEREAAIGQTYRFDSSPFSRLDIVAASFHVNGSFLGLRSVEDGTLQLCGNREIVNSAFTFGTAYRQECQLRVDSLRQSGKGGADQSHHATPTFYDLFLRFTDDQGKEKLYQIPILNSLVQARGKRVNEDQQRSQWILTRRFFLVDSLSSRTENGTCRVIRYASRTTLNVKMQTTRDGLILPPYLHVEYEEIDGTGHDRKDGDKRKNDTVPAEFQVKYSIDPFRHDKDLEISMAVLSSLSVFVAAINAYSWGRRAGKQVADASTVLQFILYEVAALGDVFMIVMITMSCWLTFAYKSQTYVFYIMLSEDQEWSFCAYVIAALVLKFLALLHRNVQLMLTETFFVDWERPKILNETNIGKPVSQNVAKDRQKQPVVIWRTYLVANEWNELQNYRKTSVGVQVLSVFLLLDLLGWRHWSLVQPGFSSQPAIDGAHSCQLTKFAVAAGAYLLVGFAQWTINVLVLERMVLDPFHNFIDLCSIANISVLSLTHPLHGYYIHGRSVHGRADTDMGEMNEFLQRERDNMCGFRGLESNAELQTFAVSLPLKFRERFDDIRKSAATQLPQIRLQGIDQTTAKMASTSRVHSEMNTFLQEFVDHSLTDCDYSIRDESFLESVLDMELADTSQIGTFTRDRSETAYSRCFVYGNEWTHLSFECLLFSTLFIFTDSLALASAVTYLASHSIRQLASSLFTNHLVKSSLVDQRFLI